MNKWINELIGTDMRAKIDKSRHKLAADDEIYKRDKADLKELEDYYLSLNIEYNDRVVINDYIACMQTTNQRYADISYIAGIRDAIRLLQGLDLLRDMDN